MSMMQDDDLDRLLAKAARQSMDPSQALLDRVLADALALQPAPPGLALAAPRRRGVMSRLAAVFGGGVALAGLTSAAAAGVVFGYLSPATLDSLTGGLTGVTSESVELFPDSDFLVTEG
jgi:zinc transporter ZupT